MEHASWRQTYSLRRHITKSQLVMHCQRLMYATARCQCLSFSQINIPYSLHQVQLTSESNEKKSCARMSLWMVVLTVCRIARLSWSYSSFTSDVTIHEGNSLRNDRHSHHWVGNIQRLGVWGTRQKAWYKVRSIFFRVGGASSQISNIRIVPIIFIKQIRIRVPKKQQVDRQHVRILIIIRNGPLAQAKSPLCCKLNTSYFVQFEREEWTRHAQNTLHLEIGITGQKISSIFWFQISDYDPLIIPSISFDPVVGYMGSPCWR